MGKLYFNWIYFLLFYNDLCTFLDEPIATYSSLNVYIFILIIYKSVLVTIQYYLFINILPKTIVGAFVLTNNVYFYVCQQ